MRARLDRPSAHRTRASAAPSSSAVVAARSGPALAGLSTADTTRLRAILDTNPAWHAFVEEFGDEPVLALIKSQGWTGNGSQIVDASGRAVDPKLVRKLLEQQLGGASGSGAKSGQAARTQQQASAANSADADSAVPSSEPAAQR